MSEDIVCLYVKMPITRMIIDRDSGNINEYFTIVKGQLIDLYAFATIGHTDNDQPNKVA